MSNQQMTVQQKQDYLMAVVGEPKRFADLLPPDVDVNKFIAVIKRGLQQNPALFNADKASLILSCQNAAQDGLMPDNREGALVMYGNKVQWQPMIGGIRKRAADAGFDIRADVVYENDEFDYELGDNPRIHHKAPKLGQPRGKMIGAYAIATGPDGEKYRDVMDSASILATAAVSKSKQNWNGPFAGEMWKKTVARRLFKTLPMGSGEKADLAAGMIQRDDERNFAFDRDQAAGPSDAAKRAQAAARGQEAPSVATAPTRPASDEPDGSVIDSTATEVTDDVDEDDGRPF